MKSIVLAEKPSVGRDLAKVLNCHSRSNGFIEGKDYIVTWALGHLVTLAEPADYEKRWGHWNLDYLPMLPEKMKLKTIRKTSKQLQVIKKLFKRDDINELIIATDAGREGELVARWIMKKAGWKKKPVKRLWISSQTNKAILAGFRNLKPAKLYEPLFKAAVCRAEADWIIGLNVTRTLTCKFNAQLNAGRVQTPTLAMITERENNIRNFTPKSYSTIKVDFGNYFGNWQNESGSTRIFAPNKANEIVKQIEGKTGIISVLEEENKKELPPLAYDLTELQRDANRKFGFSAKHTLSVLQNLYERHKIVTYPRTDSRYITSDMVETLPTRLKQLNFGTYQDLVKPLLSKPLQTTKRLVNDAKVSDHHAIIPTEQRADLNILSTDEKRLFDLIALRFIAVLYPNYTFKSLKLITRVENHNFISRGKSTINSGWRTVTNLISELDTDEEKIIDQPLKNLKKGDKFKIIKCHLKVGKTNPPANYTEATLLSAMENPGKFIDDQKLKISIKAGGLGTPATRADIIEKLVRAHYIIREGKSIKPTQKAFELIRLVPENLKSAELTAKWELKLSEIATQKYADNKFMTEIRQSTIEMVNGIKANETKYIPPNLLKQKCPLCGKQLQQLGSKIICSNRHCEYEQNKSKKPGLRTGRMNKKEYGMNKHLLHKYGKDEKKDSAETFGDLFDL
ncbi:MAG: DNA topoisomerase III [Candidatus Cloacimonetes bacterium]|nr:DNA topoisomerase III [Candidatus Cloacimonadota bacterium]